MIIISLKIRIDSDYLHNQLWIRALFLTVNKTLGKPMHYFFYADRSLNTSTNIDWKTKPYENICITFYTENDIWE